jgi:hypothetical protein
MQLKEFNLLFHDDGLRGEKLRGWKSLHGGLLNFRQEDAYGDALSIDDQQAQRNVVRGIIVRSISVRTMRI